MEVSTPQKSQVSVTSAVHPVRVRVVSAAFEEQLSVVRLARLVRSNVPVMLQALQSNVVSDVKVVVPFMAVSDEQFAQLRTVSEVRPFAFSVVISVLSLQSNVPRDVQPPTFRVPPAFPMELKEQPTTTRDVIPLTFNRKSVLLFS